MGTNNPANTPPHDPLVPQLDKPDWSEWSSVKQAKLWEAVALAISFYSFGERKLDLIYNRTHPSSFTKLLKLALGNISVGGVLRPSSIDFESPDRSQLLMATQAAPHGIYIEGHLKNIGPGGL